MEPTRELVDALYREKVLRARNTPLEQKFFAGPELFVYACEIMEAGIRNQYPDADEARIQELIRERFALAERLRQRR